MEVPGERQRSDVRRVHRRVGPVADPGADVGRGPMFKLYFRSEVRDIERIPDGGVLIVSNHPAARSPSTPTLWWKFFETFGWDRPFYTLGLDLLFTGPLAAVMKRLGMIRATRENAAAALRSGAVVVVFRWRERRHAAHQPAGRHRLQRADRLRQHGDRGRCPIVPVVAIGGQETQLFLTRGEWLAKRLGIAKRITRVEQFPVSIGFPFGLSIGFLQPSAAVQTRHPGAGTHRHHRDVRHEPGYRRSRHPCTQGDAGRPGRVGRPAPIPGPGVRPVQIARGAMRFARW